ncbi:putative LRR receptor-like serine/threonine-protein kinase At1g05700 [Tasmannia lanceolata]|uniref:putative LRR receptor-like serine/threonine-protein kinase At1g05700 n=1 Tax=Tasmannia lanceolata TaxID=3420 RepID=UPI004063038E
MEEREEEDAYLFEDWRQASVGEERAQLLLSMVGVLLLPLGGDRGKSVRIRGYRTDFISRKHPLHVVLFGFHVFLRISQRFLLVANKTTILLPFHGNEVYFPFRFRFLGATEQALIEWYPDHDFIDTGYNGQVLQDAPYWSKQMNSLRFFSDQNKNCYTLPASSQEKYLVRAGFYYGNYDGRSKPPIFDLQFDGNLWATVNSSLHRPLLYEAIVVSKHDNISVCVARTRDDELPFISTLVLISLPSEMYGEMESNHALFNKYRVDFGGSEASGYLIDTYRRIWYPINLTRYPTVIADYISPSNSLDDDPPFTVVQTAIEAPSPSDSIILTFNLDQPQIKQSKYITLYFTEVKDLGFDENRTFYVYMDGENYNLTVSPRYEMYDEISGNTNPNVGSFNLTLAPTQNSTLPPIISAMELFTVSEDLVEGTMDDDVRGLAELAYNSKRIRRWTGDPCIPANTVWEWLRCNNEDPPRVTAL